MVPIGIGIRILFRIARISFDFIGELRVYASEKGGHSEIRGTDTEINYSVLDGASSANASRAPRIQPPQVENRPVAAPDANKISRPDSRVARIYFVALRKASSMGTYLNYVNIYKYTCTSIRIYVMLYPLIAKFYQATADVINFTKKKKNPSSSEQQKII